MRGTSKGLGLIGIEERVSLLGGTLTLESKPGMGTTVVVEIPLEMPEEEMPEEELANGENENSPSR